MCLSDALRLPHAAALDEIRGLEEAIRRESDQDRSLLEDLMLAYRERSAWGDMVRVADSFPPDLRREPRVIQQVALALNRDGRREAAESELAVLIERTGGDSETYGILGRIRKDQWLETDEHQDLDRAIDAYRRGYELDPTDYYPGINLATLLTVRGDVQALARNSNTSFRTCGGYWPTVPRPDRRTTGRWRRASSLPSWTATITRQRPCSGRRSRRRPVDAPEHRGKPPVHRGRDRR